MPKNTFYNLPEEKKEKIIAAAKEEFTIFPLYKARVSNIISKAGIPRGSFYQYFVDLEDLYFYVIDKYLDNIYSVGAEYISKTTDLIEFANLTFDYDYDAFSNDSRHKFMGNVLRSISDNEEYIKKFNDKRTTYIKMIFDEMDTTKIRFQNEEEFYKIYHLIQSIKRMIVQKSMFDKLSKEEALKEFKWHLNIIENGIMVK